MSSVIAAVRDFILMCPYLKEFDDAFANVELDKLEEDATNYMVASVPAEPVVKRYTNGDTIRRVVFYFSSRVFYGNVENVDTSEFYELFSEWLEDCTKNNNLPSLSSDKTPLKIKATTDGYLVNAETHTAQYQIQCEFIYFRKRR